MIPLHSYPSPPRLVAPGGPVTRALAVMAAADDDFLIPQFHAPRVDATALSIALCGMVCWIAPAALWMGGVL